MTDLEAPGPSEIYQSSVEDIQRNGDEGNDSGSPILIKLLADKPLIWKPEDWLKLQKNRIAGNLIGAPANFPRQVSENGLPMLLLPEEVTLILEKNLGIICSYKKDRQFPSEINKREYTAYLEKNKEEQIEYYKEICKEQVKGRIDSIIEGKRRKLLAKRQKESGHDENMELQLDKEALVESELEKRLAAATSTHLIQIPTASPYVSEEDLVPVDWKFPETPNEKIRYKVFKDLYDRGYTLTQGRKFGGDFLAYPGEPWKFHAFFIIKCLEYDDEVPLKELVESARLSVFTRKNLVLASVDEDNKVFYNTISWPA